MNLSHKMIVWWESPLATIQVQKRNTARYDRKLPYMVWGYPPGHGIQFQCMEILFGCICHTSELLEQSIRFSQHIVLLSSTMKVQEQ